MSNINTMLETKVESAKRAAIHTVRIYLLDWFNGRRFEWEKQAKIIIIYCVRFLLVGIAMNVMNFVYENGRY